MAFRDFPPHQTGTALININSPPPFSRTPYFPSYQVAPMHYPQFYPMQQSQHLQTGGKAPPFEGGSAGRCFDQRYGCSYSNTAAANGSGGSLYKAAAKQMLPIRVIGDVLVKDFENSRFVGAGGAIRLFLLGKQIKHTFSPVDKETWQNEKDLLAQAYHLPLPELPVLAHNGVGFYGTTAILRYLTKKLGEYGSDVQKDFVADVVTDKLSVWRSSLNEAIDIVVAADPQPALYNYLSRRSSFFDEFESILGYYVQSNHPGSVYFTGNNPVMCDYYLFGILYDDEMIMQSVQTDNALQQEEQQETALLEERLYLKTLYSKLACHPQIAEFISTPQSKQSDRPPSPPPSYRETPLRSCDQTPQKAHLNSFLLNPTQMLPPAFHHYEHLPIRNTSSASYEPPPQSIIPRLTPSHGFHALPTYPQETGFSSFSYIPPPSRSPPPPPVNFHPSDPLGRAMLPPMQNKHFPPPCLSDQNGWYGSLPSHPLRPFPQYGGGGGAPCFSGGLPVGYGGGNGFNAPSHPPHSAQRRGGNVCQSSLHGSPKSEGFSYEGEEPPFDMQ